jgi:hypothetical protein
MALTPGARIGVYEVVRRIGAGGTGEVYLARDATLNRNVALRVLPEAFVRDEERLARFTREARVLASLDHLNIARVHGLENPSPDVRALSRAARRRVSRPKTAGVARQYRQTAGPLTEDPHGRTAALPRT